MASAAHVRHDERMPIKSQAPKESSIDRTIGGALCEPRGESEGARGLAAEHRGLPKLEVGIMGRINMQGLDTCRGKGKRSNTRGRGR